jgi:hypothetical protein
VRIDTLAGIEGVEEKENGIEIEDPHGATQDETMMIDPRGGIEIYLMTEEAAADVGVVEEGTAMILARVAESARRVQLLHPRRRSRLQI